MTKTVTKEQVWEALREPPGLVDNPNYGDLMTVANFLVGVECGGFIDYDGHGNWSNGTKCLASHTVYPSAVKEGITKVPQWATHIMWFNR